jgi:hypothetical protein
MQNIMADRPGLRAVVGNNKKSARDGEDYRVLHSEQLPDEEKTDSSGKLRKDYLVHSSRKENRMTPVAVCTSAR